MDGTAVDYNYWNPGQPDSNDNVDYCSYVWWSDGHDGHWDDTPCDKYPKGFVCQKRKGEILYYLISIVLYAILIKRSIAYHK